MIILKSINFYLAIIGILLAIIYSNFTERPRNQILLARPPPSSPFMHYISASGIIEATDKNILLGSPEQGLVQKLWVKVGDYVQKGDPIFELDTRVLKAKLLVQQLNIEVAKADLKKYQDQLQQFKLVEDLRSISQEDFITRENNVRIAEAKLKTAEAEFLQTQQLIDRLVIRAPTNGVILQTNIRVGENIPSDQAPIILGDIKQLQLRVSIDEQNASQFKENSSAVAIPKNNTTVMFPLKFMRIEPFIIPKRSLTGLSQERIDTRVLQVIYSFEYPTQYRVYVGQQMDVFIEK